MMKSAFSLVLLLLCSLAWGQNIVSPANITANELLVPLPLSYSNGVIANQTTFGVFPNTDSSLWDNSPNRMGGTLSKSNDEGNFSSDEFLFEIDTKMMDSGVAIINSSETSGSVVTLAVANSSTSQACGTIFCSGTNIALRGLTTATWLNYQNATVTSVTGTSITFSDPTHHGTSASHSDTGKVSVAAFKGPIFVGVVNYDSSSNVAANAYTSYTHIASGVQGGYGEGVVAAVDTPCLTTNPCTSDTSVKAAMTAGEFDVDNNTGTDGTADILCESGAPSGKFCKVNLFLGSAGTNYNNWFILGDVIKGAAGGIMLTGVKNGGPALVSSNQSYIAFKDVGGTLQTALTNTNVGGSSSMTVLGSSSAPPQLSSPTVTIVSGFGSSPSITNPSGTSSFLVHIGAGGTATTGILGFSPSALTGWNCFCTDTQSSNFCKQGLGGGGTQAVIANVDGSGTLTPWSSGEVINVSCFAR